MKVGLVGDSLTEGRPGVSFSKLLMEKFPDINIVNLGKPGETVKSLHTRLTKTILTTDYDLLFLWIGVNDVYSKMLKMQAQPVVKNQEEFHEYFKRVLDLVTVSPKHVVTVSPALVGENIKNEANKDIRELSKIIESLSNKYSNVCFLNLQSVFEKYLSEATSSDYISTGIFRVMIDVLFYKDQKRIDQLSKSRGLQLTLDGIHLNSVGAAIVAEKYAKIIENLLVKTNTKRK
ncbi:GDSL-type esterase/lipase family protein [Bacillus sp. FJAT-49736]|uniref:SGNH/GDSL hydrolase family protein n=1 Tax=Bacillus sp. FJAT-49736 TaxID=2833582 RepID=UPI001BCA4783|nr:GDSL-type esterase/lipase family protein [Bacillus sp. FJAT-49736]MBS4172699.1 SGNH/GDSL hydrolase family protein [Bacillus sp. FJAT-49736]